MWLVPDRLSGFTSDGLDFDTLDEGPLEGEVILALHGFPQRATSWRGVTPHLTGAGYRVVAPDQRGYSPGARPREVSAYRLDRLGGDVLALADAAGAERFHLLGHDWGGLVGWHLAAGYPDRVRTLSVASTPHPRALLAAFRGRQALRSWYMAFFQLPVLPEALLQARNGAIARRLAESSGAPHPDESVDVFREPGAATATINWYRAFLRPGMVAPGPVHIPVLYVWSDHDTALGRQAAEATRKWVTGDYRFEIFSGVSHWIPEERPAELAALVLERISTA
jgi:pimeloyl-ACP methyl ester carboxylesterase